MIPLHYCWGMVLTHAPIGPSQWTAKNWVGFFLQVLIFFLALFFITKLADLEEEGEEKTSSPPSNEKNSPSPNSETTPEIQAKANEVQE